MKTKLNNTSAFRNFDWEKAKTFYYVVHLGSFTKASEFLRKSQPALSRQISGLEKQFGSPLLLREHRGIRPTRKGEELLAIVEDTFTRLSAFTSKDKKTIERGKPRTIRIGIQRGYEYLVMGGLESYQQAHHSLTFEIVQDIPENSLRMLDLDIAFRAFDSDAYEVAGEHSYLPIKETGKNIAVEKATVVVSNWNFLFPKWLYMVIHSSSEEDEELRELYEHLKEINKK